MVAPLQKMKAIFYFMETVVWLLGKPIFFTFVREGGVWCMGTSVKNLIEQDLISQLEERGVLLKYHEDLVKDYLSYYDIKRKLITDIKKRGVSVFYQNGENQKGYKRNESISELNKVTATMLKILSELGLKPPQKASDGDSGNADLL